MSSGARQVIYLAAEQTPGVLPTSPAWKTLPFVSTSLGAQVNKTDSDTISDGRIGRGGVPTSMEVAGDIQVNAAYGTYDDLLAAAFFNEWGGTGKNELTIGTTRKTFHAVRGYTDIENYQTFKGLHVAKFNLEIPDEGQIKLTFGFQGMSREKSATKPAGTIAPAQLSEEFTNVGVGELKVDGVSLKGVACVTAFSLELDNGINVQRCLGDGLNVGKLLEGKAAITGSFTAAWSQKSAEIYEKQFANGKISLEIPFGDAAGNQYILTLPVLTVTGELPSGSATDLLSATFNFTVQDESPKLKRVPKTARASSGISAQQ